LAAAGLLFGLASSAFAGILVNQNSVLSINLGALPTLSVTGTYKLGGSAMLTDAPGGKHDLWDGAKVWKTTGLESGSSLLTGVALITNLTLTVENRSGHFTSNFSIDNPIGGNQLPTMDISVALCPDGCLGGTEGLNGQFVIQLLNGGFTIPFTLSVIGIGGQAAVNIIGGQILATGAPFVTGKFKITGVTTNIIQMPDRGFITGVGVTLAPAATEEVRTYTTQGGFITDNTGGVLLTLGTVTVQGTNSLGSASQAGMVTLVSPQRVNTGPLGVGNIPGLTKKKFVFVDVPEPGTVLLLVSGAAGLIFIGRKRMRS
jgi:hypothetical protein